MSPWGVSQVIHRSVITTFNHCLCTFTFQECQSEFFSLPWVRFWFKQCNRSECDLHQKMCNPQHIQSCKNGWEMPKRVPGSNCTLMSCFLSVMYILSLIRKQNLRCASWGCSSPARGLQPVLPCGSCPHQAKCCFSGPDLSKASGSFATPPQEAVGAAQAKTSSSGQRERLAYQD